MKKVLIVLVILIATSSFVSCNDTDENTEVLQEQIDQQATNGEDEVVNTDKED